MTTNKFIYLNRSEYFTQLARLAAQTKKGDRIAVATMPFDSQEPLVAVLMQELYSAADRGVDVNLSIDAYAFLSRKQSVIPGPLWFNTSLSRKLPHPYDTWLAALKALEAHGGNYTITNIPTKPYGIIPAGRSHVKGAVINNYVFIGGCNLEHAEEADVMVVWRDGKTADWLYQWIHKLVATGSTRKTFGETDKSFTTPNGAQLFIDAGLPKQSIIYDHALQLIDSAREYIFMTCQYFPGGKTGQHLLAAYKRGVDVRIIFAHPQAHGQKAFAHHLYNFREQLRLPHDFFVERRARDAARLHAKILVSDSGAMVGSHNYVSQGVLLGTAEIAMYSTEPSVGEHLIQKIVQQL